MKFFILTLAMMSSMAYAGWENGNAGDTYAAEFRLSARDIVQRLELVKIGDRPAYDVGALRAVLDATVVSEDRVYLNLVEVDAANYPSQRLIKVNRMRWNELRRSTETRARWRVVLHEYLWLSGVDDTDFLLSDKLIGYLNPTNYSPNIWWNPVNPANRIAPSLSFKPEDCAFDVLVLNLAAAEENHVMETKGSGCGNAYRQLRIEKITGLTPVSSAIRGRFHKYDLSVYDRQGLKLGELGFEPEWGACLLPDESTCRVSGKMTIGGVEIVFWFLRE
jgi:hypothetical protein